MLVSRAALLAFAACWPFAAGAQLVVPADQPLPAVANPADTVPDAAPVATDPPVSFDPTSAVRDVSLDWQLSDRDDHRATFTVQLPDGTSVSTTLTVVADTFHVLMGDSGSMSGSFELPTLIVQGDVSLAIVDGDATTFRVQLVDGERLTLPLVTFTGEPETAAVCVLPLVAVVVFARTANGRPGTTTAHVALTGETIGYYEDFAAIEAFEKVSEGGFFHDGTYSTFRGRAHGHPVPAEVPNWRLVTFAQDHDQIGNRAMGERLDALAPAARVEALLTLLLLSPQVPMLFMGEEFAATTPFLYFCDHAGDLAHAVTDGRRNEFARFAAFSHPEARERIPDPNAASTFDASTLRWAELHRDAGQRRLQLVTRLLALRREHLWPLVPQLRGAGRYGVQGDALHVHWQADDGSRWHLRAQLGDGPARLPVGPDEQALHLHAARLEEGACHFDGPGALVSFEPALRAAGQ